MQTWPKATSSRTLLLAGLVLGLFLTGLRVEGALPTALVWLGVAFLAETLRHPARDGVVPITVSPAVHLPALVFVPGLLGPVGNTLAAFLGGARFHGNGIRGAVRHAGAVLLASLPAWALLRVGGVGVPADGPGHGIPPAQIAWFAAAGLLYHGLYQLTLAFATRRERGLGWLPAWRESFGYGTELLTTTALLLVSMLGLFGYAALGPRGLLLCVMPLLFARDGSRRYLELERAQSQMLETERLAAKGEMAAEIGHELNNYLAAISGRAQLLGMSERARDDEELETEVLGIRDLAVRMAGLAQGLMDFSHREARPSRFGVEDLLRRTVELVRPQARYRGVDFAMETVGEVPEVEMDPGQIQQAFLTLLRRAAGNRESGAVRVRTRADREGRRVAVLISTGDAEEAFLVERPASRVSRRHGGDPELGAVRRIVERHQGRLHELEDEERQEAFRVVLPAA